MVDRQATWGKVIGREKDLNDSLLFFSTFKAGQFQRADHRFFGSAADVGDPTDGSVGDAFALGACPFDEKIVQIDFHGIMFGPGRGRQAGPDPQSFLADQQEENGGALVRVKQPVFPVENKFRGGETFDIGQVFRTVAVDQVEDQIAFHHAHPEQVRADKEFVRHSGSPCRGRL